MRLREQPSGALNLLHQNQPQDIDLRAAQALADVATIGILHQEGTRASDLIIEQLQAALNSRVLIEQANRTSQGRARRHGKSRHGRSFPAAAQVFP
jgi:hypothetical protein